MATERLSMRKTRQIIRRRMLQKMSAREVADSLEVGIGSVYNVIKRFEKVSLDWPSICELSDDQLEQRLYEAAPQPKSDRNMPSMEYLHQELHKTGVTLQLLHIEYLEQNPDGYRYTQFCEYYRRWLKKNKLSMTQIHPAGKRMFVDYSGKRPEIVDAETGECTKVELFVAVLGASSCTYAEASRTQKSEDWIRSHQRAFEYFGGVTELVVPDQLRSGVSRPCWYEPGVQRTYDEMADHYDTTIMPARGRRPKDKAKVEVGVQVAQRWIMARLRNETFFSLVELNKRIAELLVDLNNRPMRKYGKSRRELFETLDKPALKPLPLIEFSFARWKLNATVHLDYHVQFENRFYSVPFQLRGEKVDIRANALSLEIICKNKRVASHVIMTGKGLYSTKPEHMPKSHRAHSEWSPARFMSWAGKIGENTERLVTAILEERPHPEMGYRSCLGILRLEKRYGAERLEKASARAFFARARSYKHVEAILKNSLDKIPLPEISDEPAQLSLAHENVRGPEYYNDFKTNTGEEKCCQNKPSKQ